MSTLARVSSAGDAGADRVERPWGYYAVVDKGSAYQVKRICVRPGHRLSYQRHERRAEHWTFVSGTAIVTIDGEDREVAVGATVDVPVRAAHRVSNPGTGDVIFVEVQTGAYLGEDDIIRLHDDYDR